MLLLYVLFRLSYSSKGFKCNSYKLLHDQARLLAESLSYLSWAIGKCFILVGNKWLHHLLQHVQICIILNIYIFFYQHYPMGVSTHITHIHRCLTYCSMGKVLKDSLDQCDDLLTSGPVRSSQVQSGKSP